MIKVLELPGMLLLIPVAFVRSVLETMQSRITVFSAEEEKRNVEDVLAPVTPAKPRPRAAKPAAKKRPAKPASAEPAPVQTAPLEIDLRDSVRHPSSVKVGKNS